MQRENTICLVLLDPIRMPSFMHYTLQRQTHAA